MTLMSSSSPSLIIDLLATVYMISMHSIFKTYKFSTSRGCICVANGNCTQLWVKALLMLLSVLSLPFVLHVPQLPHNLLFVSALIKSHNCSVTFFPSSCDDIQDLETGQTIGGGGEHNGLHMIS